MAIIKVSVQRRIELEKNIKKCGISLIYIVGDGIMDF